MYKQFLEYQRSTMNAAETFVKITDNMQATVEYLKQSFSARGVATENIYFETDDQKRTEGCQCQSVDAWDHVQGKLSG